MKLKHITGVARNLDLRYPTNLAIFLVAITVSFIGLMARLNRGDALVDAVLWGNAAAFSALLTWAIGRELDPDYELSAFVGVALFLLSLLFYDIFHTVWALLLLLLILRIVNRSNGLRATWLDGLGLAIFAGGWVGLTGNWVYGVVAVLAFLLDAFLPAPSRRQLLFALAVLLVIFFWQGEPIVDSLPMTFPVVVWLLAGVTAVLFIALIILRSNQIHSLGDATKQPLSASRVQAAQLLALLTALLLLWQGTDLLFALWSAMLGAALYRIYAWRRHLI